MTEEKKILSEAFLARARLHLVRALSDSKPQVLKEFLKSGYPVDSPIIEETSKTLLMLCCSLKSTTLEMLEIILAYNPDINQ